MPGSTTEAVLAVDLGTTGLKVALVSLAGEVLSHEVTALETHRSPDGAAEQDADAWWAAIVASTRRLLEQDVVRPAAVVAVNCTGQWGSTVPVGADGAAVGRCLLWMDGRGRPWSSRTLGGLGPIEIEGYGPTKALRFIRKASGAPALQGADPLGHILYLRHQAPDVYAATATFLEPVDFLTLRLTGRAAATPASMILSWLVDIRDLRRPAYAPDLLRISTRERRHLPELVPTGSVVATTSGDIVEQAGLPAGIPVVAGIPDLLSACTGSGALGDFECHMAISTSSWLSCHVPFKKTDPLRQVATVPGVMPERYLVANNHDTAGACLDWARHAMFSDAMFSDAVSSDAVSSDAVSSDAVFSDGVFVHGAPTGDGERRPASFVELDAAVQATAAGSGGVLFAPWLTGERCPVDDRNLRGSFLNLSLSTTRPQLVRSLYEGVALNARWMQDAVERFLERPVGPIRFIGGGASSPEWCQIHADVLGRPVHQVAEPLLANVRGAALFAALSLGKLDVAGATRAVRVQEVFTPAAANRSTYDALYDQFRQLYKQQRRMYASLNGSRGPRADRPVA